MVKEIEIYLEDFRVNSRGNGDILKGLRHIQLRLEGMS